MAQTAFKYDFTNGYYWEVAAFSFTVYWGGIVVAVGTSGTEITSSYGTFYQGTQQANPDHFSVSRKIPDSPPTVGSVIYGADYNAVQVKAGGILGTGTYYGGPSNGYGYGQTVSSSAVSPTDIITAAQWDNLVGDLNKCYLHQEGSNFSEYSNLLTNISNVNPITYENLSLIGDVASFIVSNRSSIYLSNQSTVVTGANQYINIQWGGEPGYSAQLVHTADFTQAGGTNGLHHYFNAGGRIYIFGIVDTSLYTETDQENAWVALVNTLNTPITYSQWQTIFANANSPVTLASISSSTTPYTGATISITATFISASSTLRILTTFTDGHTATGEGPDFIRSGLVGVRFDEWEISGAFSLPITGTMGTWV